MVTILCMLGIAAVGALIAASAWSQRPIDVGLVGGKLRPCPKSPNCVCSETADSEAFVMPFAVEGDPERALADMVELLRSDPRIEIVTVGPDYVHAVARTPLLRFADDLELRSDPAAGVIHVRSASRVGHSDFGANRKRVEALRAAWKTRVRGSADAVRR